jgi:hypothetical protein
MRVVLRGRNSEGDQREAGSEQQDRILRLDCSVLDALSPEGWRMSSAAYLGWWADPKAKRVLTTRLKEAITAFTDRFGASPPQVLIPETEGAPEQVDGIPVVQTNVLAADIYWLGPLTGEQLRW